MLWRINRITMKVGAKQIMGEQVQVPEGYKKIAGVVVKCTGSLAFLRGQLQVRGELVMSFQAVMRRLKKPSQAS